MVICTEDYQECEKCPRQRCSIRLFSTGLRVKRRYDIEEAINKTKGRGK